MGEKYSHAAWFCVCHLLNVCDALLTLIAVSQGVEEANPIMAWTLAIGPAFFLTVKFTIFSVALTFIYKKAPALLAPIGLLFTAVVAWHMYFWPVI